MSENSEKMKNLKLGPHKTEKRNNNGTGGKK